MFKKILITGGAGYIGSACTQMLRDEGHTVVIFDNLSTCDKNALPKDIKCVVGDVTNYEDLRAVAEEHNFDAVIHAAAKKSVGESEQNPTLYYENNVVGSFNVLRMMEEFAIPQIIFSSTAAVYEPPQTPAVITEESPIKPVNVYGQTKLMVEQMIETFARTGKISQYVIFRYFNVAGDAGLLYQDNLAQNVFPLLARSAVLGHSFKVLGNDYATKDGTGVRDYIHLNDLVKAHNLALGSKKSGIYNLGTGLGYSVNDLIDTFAAEIKAPLNIEIAPRRQGDPAELVSSFKKAESELGWKPEATLKEMVTSTLAAYNQ